MLMRQGSRYGVRLKASAPTLHLIRSDIETEIAPVLGMQEQSEAFVDTLREAFEKAPQSLWDTNFFGKSLKGLIQEGVMSKLNRMSVDTREKVQAALTKMLNEGDGGMICILLGCHNVAPKIPCTFFRICGMINRVQSTGIRMENEAFALYTEQDYQDIASQLRRRWIALLIPSVLMLAGVVASFVARIRPLTIGLSIALGVIFIFCFGMFISPVNAYLRHLDDVLHGRVRQVTGAFKSMDQQSVTRDGVRYYPMMINVGSMEDEEDDRLFYYDANLPRPDWQVGEKLTVTAHDKALGAWERAA